LQHRFREHPAVQKDLPKLTNDVENGTMTPSAAAQQLLKHLQ
jgi:hypothetical protein